MGMVQQGLFGRKRQADLPPAQNGKKRCCRCGKTKSIKAFRRMAAATDGHSSHCKKCADSPPSDVLKARSWMRNYGLTVEAYWEMFEAQGGVCAICHKAETWILRGTPAHLSVDHNHSTGKVRALLCAKCNRKLAYYEDREWAELASSYLARYDD